MFPAAAFRKTGPMQAVWSKIQSILEKQLPSGQFKAWIATLVPVWESGCLIFCAQSEFAASHVRSWYGQLLREAVATALGRQYHVRVECRPGSPGAVPAAGGAPLTIPSSVIFLPEDASIPDAAGQPLLSEATITRAVSQPVGPDESSGRRGTPVALPVEPGVIPSGAPALCHIPGPSPRPLEQIHLALPLQVAGSVESATVHELSWRHSFDDFVVGPSNELAYAASRSICNEAMHMDILFLSSAPGLGKTHLLHAVGKKLCEACNKSRPHVECLTAEEFASRFYLSLKSQDTDRFKGRYRKADLLLLEDVHFLQGKEKMQAELLATIKALGERGSKVVFSSSFAPRELKQLDEQLQSRFSSGLLTSIEKPDEEMRRRIFRTKASLQRVSLPQDVEEVLARHIHADVRQIESCLHTLILKARLLNSSITMQMAWEVISNYAAHTPVLDMEAIITYVCRGFGLTREQLHSASRKQEYVCARNTAFFLARKHTDLSLAAIGRQFNRKHSTVLKGITSLEREMSLNTPLGRQMTNVLSMIERNGNVIDCVSRS